MAITITSVIAEQDVSSTRKYFYLYEPLYVEIEEAGASQTFIELRALNAETGALEDSVIEYGSFDLDPVTNKIKVDLMKMIRQYDEANRFKIGKAESIDWKTVITEYNYDLRVTTDLTPTATTLSILPIVGVRSFLEFDPNIGNPLNMPLNEFEANGIENPKFQDLENIDVALRYPISGNDVRPIITITTPTSTELATIEATSAFSGSQNRPFVEYDIIAAEIGSINYTFDIRVAGDLGGVVAGDISITVFTDGGDSLSVFKAYTASEGFVTLSGTIANAIFNTAKLNKIRLSFNGNINIPAGTSFQIQNMQTEHFINLSQNETQPAVAQSGFTISDTEQVLANGVNTYCGDALIWKSRLGGWCSYGFDLVSKTESISYLNDLDSELMADSVDASGEIFVEPNYTQTEESYTIELRAVGVSAEVAKGLKGIAKSPVVFYKKKDGNGRLELVRVNSLNAPLNNLANGTTVTAVLKNISKISQNVR